MTFLNEKIPDEYKEKLNSMFNLKLSDTQKNHGWWTADKDRSAFLFMFDESGGSRVGTKLIEKYVFYINGTNIFFDATKDSIKKNGSYTLKWKIFNLKIPVANKDQENEITDLIRNAIDTKGFTFSKERISDVIIEIDPAQ